MIDSEPKLVFVTAIFGANYAPFLLTHLYSFQKYHPEAKHLVLWHDLPQHEIDLMQKMFPGNTFVNSDEQAHGPKSYHRIARKLHLWNEACQEFPEHTICFLDVDLVMVRSLHNFLQEPKDFDAIFTWQNRKFPVNVGVFIVRNGQIGRLILTEWAHQMEDVLANDLDSAVQESGAADQHALRRMIGWEDYNRTIPVEIEGQILRFKGVSCTQLNQTFCAPIDSDTYIIHYKAGWHPILFRNAPFNKMRPEQRCKEMYAYYTGQTKQANADRIPKFIYRSCDLHIDTIQQLGQEIGFESRGILHSEMLMVCALCEELRIDVLIESGRCRGQSTLMLVRYFADKSRPNIVSIEFNRDENARVAEQRLKNTQVKLIYGDSFTVMPRIVRKSHGKRIALLIDGPKGEDAVNLVRQLLTHSHDIVAVFIHDTYKNTAVRRLIEQAFLRTFFTDSDTFVELYGDLDNSCLPEPGDDITIHTWRPYMKGNERRESYGPTLAAIFPYVTEGLKRPRHWQEALRQRALTLVRRTGLHVHIKKALRLFKVRG